MNKCDTYSNVLLIRATIHINRDKLCSLKQVREGVGAWNLTCRQYNVTNLPIDPVVINQALMLVNKTMSETIRWRWFE